MDFTFITWIALFWIPVIICIFLVWFFSQSARHKEKLMMMEKALTRNQIYTITKGLRSHG